MSFPTPDSLEASSIQSQTSTLVIVSTVFLVITTAFFVTRLIWRSIHQQRGWDDLMATLAYITLVIQSSFGYMSAHYGFGKHRVDIPRTFSKAMFWFWLYQICYKLIGGFTKLNFCFLYWRIFSSSKNFQRLVLTVGGVIAAGTLAFTFATVFQCIPIERNWNRAIPGTCNNLMAFWFSHSAFNTLMDLVVYILPMPLINTLQMAKRTKIGLSAIFALGAFTIAASIARMAMLPRSANSTADPTWGSTPALYWTEVEANTAVICCCLPALRQLAVQIWRGLIGKPLGPETPTNTDTTPKPKGGRSKTKTFGLVSHIRYSPETSNNDDNPNDETTLKSKPTNWLDRLWHPPSGDALSRAEQGVANQNSHAPQIPLENLGIYKTTQLEQHSNRESAYQGPKIRRDLTKEKSVGIMPVLPKPEKTLTLKEMLDEGPSFSNSRRYVVSRYME